MNLAQFEKPKSEIVLVLDSNVPIAENNDLTGRQNTSPFSIAPIVQIQPGTITLVMSLLYRLVRE